MTKFSSLFVHTWQQFEKIDIEFHPRLTVLTGANGSGKTTLLRLLAQHRGWPIQQVATPVKNKSTGVVDFFTRFFKGVDKSKETNVVGKISYSTGNAANLNLPSSNQATYQIEIQGQLHINCLFVPSHRQVFRYEPLQHLPIAKKTEQNAFDEVHSLSIQRYQGGVTQSASFFMKNALIGWAIQGHGVHDGSKAIMTSDENQKKAYTGFQEVLRKLLPKSLGFEEFEIRNMEIVFVCNHGQDEFLLETASGGVSAIIDLAWQLYMFSRANAGGFTVVLDEAENHLHPSMQREFLPNLLQTFPEATFIVSTHSPLIVGSVREANVYVLKYNDGKKVVSEKLDLADKTRNALEILDEVLGVTTTLPVWVETELASILKDVSKNGITENSFSELRTRLHAIGMGHLMPEAISKLL